ncbi:hypothetical protein GCM10010912_58960 [Paenibacillus albidus]|uniref:Uncharacterized protein n=1 Tax=Paenibacillus albidus TaxID=2041023 RepID=A0A917D1S8_9BACL|nr:hypothetical protein [Paenibacillus albidus]GGG06548.1 hypothetical protein GCM10010912_58960 [Paenibacillus albidus]
MEWNPSNYLLDKYISADLSSLTENNTLPYNKEIQWVNAFVLNATLRFRYEEKQRIYLMNFLRRIESTFHQYNYGSLELDDFLNHDKASVSKYLSAVVCIETSVSHLYQAYMIGSKMIGENLFVRNDGSSIERLNKLYNIVKHYDSAISSDSVEELNTNEATMDWLENSAALQNDDPFSFILQDLYIDDIWEETQNENEKKRKSLIKKIEKLESFAELNQLLLKEYRDELKKYEYCK